MKSYRMTIRRRRASGKLEQLVFKVEHDCPVVGSSTCPCKFLSEEAVQSMLVDVEFQVNNALEALSSSRGTVRVWIDNR